jgi:hypothetical protein
MHKVQIHKVLMDRVQIHRAQILNKTHHQSILKLHQALNNQSIQHRPNLHILWLKIQILYH